MCRWNAYFGQPLVIDELLFQTQHGLIDQALHSREGSRRPTVTGSASAGTARTRAGPAAIAASRRRGATRTCARSRRTSSHR